MKSPIDEQLMKLIELEDGLFAYRCESSKGVFLPVASYKEWVSRQPAIRHLVGGKVRQAPTKTKASKYGEVAKVCPESGYLMSRYRVSSDKDFHLHRSPTGSIWFDQGEWEIIKSEGLDFHLDKIFTVEWQNEIKKREGIADEIQNLEERIGIELSEGISELALKCKRSKYKNLAIELFLSKVGYNPKP